jgi:hypothetical protein
MHGISGIMRTSPFEGDVVIAVKLDLPRNRAQTAYMLLFRSEEIRLDPGSDFLIESYTFDTFHLDGTGGLIDYITGPLQIEWSTDDTAFEVAEAKLSRNDDQSTGRA